MSTHYHADVVIAGAGMAGLTAAMRASELDRNVVVLEKGPEPGGSMRLSNGVIYTFTAAEAARREAPFGDSALQDQVIDQLDASVQWLRTQGIEVGEPNMELPFGAPKQITPDSFTATACDRIRERGGQIWTETPVISLRTNEDGSLEGATARKDGNDVVRIDAPAVILATGGFQGNEELVETFITDRTEKLVLRANPWSTGDGLAVARRIGAKLTKGMSTFYGHNLPAPPATFSADEFTDVTQYYEVCAIALDASGQRFVDESESLIGETIAQATAKRGDGLAYYVIDDDLYSSTVLGEPVDEMVGRADAAGGRVASCPDLDALASVLSDWGVNGDRALTAIQEYNRAVSSDSPSFDPPRSRNRHPIDNPPFHVVEVVPGITFTMGGLDVLPSMEVLERNAAGSGLRHPDFDHKSTGHPIPGLFAAGTDVGNVQHYHYFGGLATALVTGKIAGTNASRAR